MSSEPSAPRYADPSPDELNVELTSSAVMQACIHSGICIRLIECITGDYTFDARKECCWEHASKIAECLDCTEFEQ